MISEQLSSERFGKQVTCVHPAVAGSWRVHHDNALSRTTFTVTDFLTKQDITQLLQPPCSPNITPSDFILSPRLERVMERQHHGLVQAIQEAVTRELKIMPVSAYHRSFNDWKSRWKCYADPEGAYFENCVRIVDNLSVLKMQSAKPDIHIFLQCGKTLVCLSSECYMAGLLYLLSMT